MASSLLERPGKEKGLGERTELASSPKVTELRLSIVKHPPPGLVSIKGSILSFAQDQFSGIESGYYDQLKYILS